MIFPRSYRRQPGEAVELNFGHPLLMGDPIFYSYGPSGKDLVTAGLGTVSGGLIARDGGVSQGQRVDTANGSSNYLSWPSRNAYDLSSPFTMFVRLIAHDVGGAAYDRVFHRDLVTGQNGAYGFLYAASTDGTAPNRLYFETRNTGTTQVGYTGSAPVVSLTKYDTYILVNDGANLLLYKNDTLIHSVSSASTYPAAGISLPMHYGASSGEATGAAVTIEFAGLVRGAWGLGAIESFVDDPYQILTTVRRRTFVGVQATVSYYPGIDIATGGWTTNTGTGTLSSKVNETVADDTNYIQSALNPVTDVCELQFLNVQTPNANTNHSVSYRIKGDASTTLRVDLIAGNGSTIVKTWTHSPAPASFTQYDQTLSTTEANSWAAAGYPGSRLRLTAG